MKKLVVSLFAGVIALAAIQSTKADVIADWTFQTSASTNNIIGAGLTPGATQGGVLADIGTGTASASHASSATAWSIPVGNGSLNSWSANNWAAGDYYQFSVSTLGYNTLSVSYDQTGSSTGPRDFVFQYSTDGSSFTTFGSYIALTNGTAANNESIGGSTTSWNSSTVQSAFNHLFDLSSVTALNDVTSVYFRVTVPVGAVNGSGGAIGTGGTDRIDNFIVNGTVIAVPEPSTLALASLGGLACLFAVRRKR